MSRLTGVGEIECSRRVFLPNPPEPFNTMQATRPRLQQLQKELDINERERGLALHFNDITEATEKHVTSVKMLEEMIDIMRKRLNELMLGFQDPEVWASTVAWICCEKSGHVRAGLVLGMWLLHG